MEASNSSTTVDSVFQTSRIFQRLSKVASRFSFVTLFGRENVFAAARSLIVILLFACLFMPSYSIGSIGTSRVDLRGEDLIFPVLLVLFFVALAGGLPGRGALSTEKAFLGFLVVSEISILIGFFLGTIDKPFVSLLYLLKWVEYFLLFCMTAQITRGEKDWRYFLKSFFLLGMAVAGYGYWEHYLPTSTTVFPNYYRLFERFPFHGNANHIGGFLVLWIGFFTGIFLVTERRRDRLLLFCALLFVLFPLIWTYSRKSYFALGGALLFPFLFQGNRKRLLFLTCILLVLGLVFPTRLSERLLDLRETLTSSDPFHSSWAGNWVMWRESLFNFDRFFLFGSGLGSRHRLFYESQYILILAETGIVGLSAFLFLVFAPTREILARFGRHQGARERGIALGWLIGFCGLMIHSLSCVSFTVSKIAIPFWFLTAWVLNETRSTA